MISCKCITYGRVNTLNELVYSYINQTDLTDTELVIINDYPLQKLHFDHPNIRIINLDKTFDSIGEKENFAVEQCKGDIIAVFDDDDIALPNHIENIKKFFVKGTGLLHWQKGILFNRPEISAITSLGNSGIVYSRDAWEGVGRHAIENAGYDTTFVNKVRAKYPVVLAEPEDASWIYYWGHRSYHMSGLGADVDGRKSALERHSDHIESERIKGNIPIGDIELIPFWEVDYKTMYDDFRRKI
jgi:glycosyltransferase involved in cell wall biosynthesis